MLSVQGLIRKFKEEKNEKILYNSIVLLFFYSIPLAAGLFNREVYLEGMRRRLNNSVPGSSTVCSIQ